MRSVCTVDECERPVKGHGLCVKHYQRWRKWGDPLLDRKPGPHGNRKRYGCQVDGCDGEHQAHGFCRTHYLRWLRHGDPTVLLTPKYKGDDITYEAAHWRVVRDRGKASEHACVDCGAKAAEWSYNHTGGDRERVGWGSHEGHLFSLDTADYESRCNPCHIRFDRR